MEDRETPRMHKYGESKTTQIMMATVRHVTSSSALRKFQADGFLLDWIYNLYWLILCLYCKKFPHNNYATKKTITQGMLDLAVLTVNVMQLKRILEVGEEYPYYVVMMTLVCLSIALQVSTRSHVLFP